MKNKTLRKPTLKTETIFEAEHRIKGEARTIAKNFVHTKPTKFLLK